MKLELKHLVSYLPYGLKIKDVKHGSVFEALNFITTPHQDFSLFKGNLDQLINDKYLKPILFPLSSLTKDDIKNFIKNFYQFNNYDLKSIDLKEWAEDLIFLINEKEPFQLSQFEYLFSKKFDVFGLIDAGLAEPVTEDFNPYK